MARLTEVPKSICTERQPNLDSVSVIPPYFVEQLTTGKMSVDPALLLEAAETAHYRAQSYRDFMVGVAIRVIGRSHERSDNGDWFEGVFVGFNIKTKPERFSNESDINIHSEQMALAKAAHALSDISIIDLAVFSPNVQPDSQSGLETDTLHPCGLCRELLADHGADHVTKIYTSDGNRISMVNFDDLLAGHAKALDITGSWSAQDTDRTDEDIIKEAESKVLAGRFHAKDPSGPLGQIVKELLTR